MLKIAIPSTGHALLTFSVFEHCSLPAPLNGADAEVNDELVLNFEDEEEAVIYSDQLERLSVGLTDKMSRESLAISDIIAAIRGDKFVQSRNDEIDK